MVWLRYLTEPRAPDRARGGGPQQLTKIQSSARAHPNCPHTFSLLLLSRLLCPHTEYAPIQTVSRPFARLYPDLPKTRFSLIPTIYAFSTRIESACFRNVLSCSFLPSDFIYAQRFRPRRRLCFFLLTRSDPDNQLQLHSRAAFKHASHFTFPFGKFHFVQKLFV